MPDSFKPKASIKTLQLPIPHGYNWGQQQPFLKLNHFPDFPQFGAKASILAIANRQGQFLGFGLYAPELQVISFIGNQSRELPSLLSQKLHQAKAKRDGLTNQTNAYRLIHHQHDDLPGVVIEHYDSRFIIRTYDSGADLLVPFLSHSLSCDFGATTILLKNHFHKRRSRNLLLQDQLLAGKQSQDNWQVLEFAQSYDYNTLELERLYPLYYRTMRQWIKNDFKDHESALIICPGENLNSDFLGLKLPQQQFIEWDSSRLTNTTQKLRELNQSFDWVILIPDRLTISTKIKTALHHLLHQIIQKWTKKGPFLLDAPDSNLWPSTLKAAAIKAKCPLELKEKAKTPLDFPNRPQKLRAYTEISK